MENACKNIHYFHENWYDHEKFHITVLALENVCNNLHDNFTALETSCK